MTSSPLVSAVIPAYNAAPFIGAAIDSVLSQTYRNVEVIVVDDGSKDNTAEIAYSFAEKDPRVRVVRQGNSGAPTARNRGISVSTGSLIAPLDADDIWLPAKIEKQISEFNTKNTGMVYCWSFTIDGNGNYAGSVQTGDAEGYIYDVLFMDNLTANGSSQMYSRAALDVVGVYNPRAGTETADYDLVLRVAQHYRIGVVRELLVGYRQLPASASRNLDRMWRSYVSTIDAAQNRTPDVSRNILRWSRAGTLAYLSGQAFGSQQYGATLNYLGRAVLADPALLLSTGTYRLARRAVKLMMSDREDAPAATATPTGSRDDAFCPPPAVSHSLREQRHSAGWWKPSNIVEARRWRIAHERSRARASRQQPNQR
jgi:glycosyltransferase involved in cell wall biosynthesis